MVNILAVLKFDVNVIVVVRPVQESYGQISGFVGVSAELTVIALAGPIPCVLVPDIKKWIDLILGRISEAMLWQRQDGHIIF